MHAECDDQYVVSGDEVGIHVQYALPNERSLTQICAFCDNEQRETTGDFSALSDIAEKLREGARAENEKSSRKMITKELKRNPPSEYAIGDKVTIKVAVPSTGGKRKSKRVTEEVLSGIVTQAEKEKHEYTVTYRWGEKELATVLPVSKITSITTAEENARQLIARKKFGSTTSTRRLGNPDLWNVIGYISLLKSIR